MAIPINGHRHVMGDSATGHGNDRANGGNGMSKQKLAVLQGRKVELEKALHCAEMAEDRDIKAFMYQKFDMMTPKAQQRLRTRADSARSRAENLRKEIRFTQQWIDEINEGAKV